MVLYRSRFVCVKEKPYEKQNTIFKTPKRMKLISSLQLHITRDTYTPSHASQPNLPCCENQSGRLPYHYGGPRSLPVPEPHKPAAPQAPGPESPQTCMVHRLHAYRIHSAGLQGCFTAALLWYCGTDTGAVASWIETFWSHFLNELFLTGRDRIAKLTLRQVSPVDSKCDANQVQSCWNLIL